MRTLNKIIVITLFTILTMLLLVVNFNYSPLVQGKIIYQIGYYLKSFDIIHFIIGIFIFSFYYDIYYDDTEFTKKNIIMSIFSIIIATIIVIGKNLSLRNAFPDITEKMQLCFCSIIFVGSYLVFYALIKKIFRTDFSKFKKKNIKRKKSKKQNKIVVKIKKIGNKILYLFNRHPFMFSFIFITLCRLPYIIIYFPFASTGDTLDSLCQFYNKACSWSKDTINLVNPNVYLNTHHPVLFTLIIGTIFKIGTAIHSATLGAFIYNILQILLSNIIFSFVIYYMKKIKTPLYLRIITLLFFGVNYFISAYTITAVKDTPSALFTLLYVVFLIQIIRNYESIYKNKINVIVFAITMFLVLTLRNNGIITIFLSYPFLFLVYKKYWKRLLIVLLIPIITYFSFNQVMYRCFDVSKGSQKEMLSVPFMQIARLVKYSDKNELSKSDIEAIDNVLDYDNLSKDYSPNIADFVKDKYNKDSSRKNLVQFFKVWAKYLVKKPNIYIESLINSTYMYFYPNDSIMSDDLCLDYRVASNFSVNDIEEFQDQKTNFYYFKNLLSKIPIISIFYQTAFYNWFLLISCAYVIYKKKYKYLIPLTPLLSVLLVCLASPLNGSIRYILPIVFSIPACVIVTYLTYKESNS